MTIRWTLPIQYADYAQWQRGELQSKESSKQLQYWLELLGSRLRSSNCRPTVPARPFRAFGVAIRRRAPCRLSSAVKALAQRHELTLFMVLYAAWAIVLSRLSGQVDVSSEHRWQIVTGLGWKD